MTEQSQPLDAASLTRMGVMQVLLGQLQQPAGVMDDKSLIAFANAVLKTHAWCIREEMAKRLKLALQKGPIDRDVIDSLIKVAIEERLEHSKTLANIALFHASTFHLPKPKTVN
jgi:hypothetical protein